MLSRMAVMLLAPAPGVTAEEAMRVYRETFDATPAASCPEVADPDAIVVCGRRARQPRLPLPIEREPGEIVRHAGEHTPDAGPCRMCTQPVGVTVGIRFDGKVSAKRGVD